jgi:uncharacterized membrane protein YqjE
MLLGTAFRPAAVVGAGFVLGFVAQAVKICVDTTLQESVDDDFRGRVFSVYDTLFNVTFVVALLGAALWLPPSGRSLPALLVTTAGYLLAAAVFARWCLRRQRRASDVLHPTGRPDGHPAGRVPGRVPGRGPAPAGERRATSGRATS